MPTAMSVRSRIFSGALLLASGVALAADDELPDAEFLEYLGSWEESEEDWLMFERDSRKKDKKRGDSGHDDEESAETKDES